MNTYVFKILFFFCSSIIIQAQSNEEILIVEKAIELINYNLTNNLSTYYNLKTKIKSTQKTLDKTNINSQNYVHISWELDQYKTKLSNYQKYKEEIIEVKNILINNRISFAEKKEFLANLDDQLKQFSSTTSYITKSFEKQNEAEDINAEKTAQNIQHTPEPSFLEEKKSTDDKEIKTAYNETSDHKIEWIKTELKKAPIREEALPTHKKIKETDPTIDIIITQNDLKTKNDEIKKTIIESESTDEQKASKIVIQGNPKEKQTKTTDKALSKSITPIINDEGIEEFIQDEIMTETENINNSKKDYQSLQKQNKSYKEVLNYNTTDYRLGDSYFKINDQRTYEDFKFEIDQKDIYEVNHKCNIRTNKKDNLTNNKITILEDEFFFSYINPQLKKHLKKKMQLECFTHIHRDGKKKFLALNIDIDSKNAKASYGQITKEMILILTFIDGEKSYLYNKNLSEGKLNFNSGKTTYNPIYEIKKEDLKKMKKKSLDTVGIFWSTGFEQYEIYNVDLLKNQLSCLDKY